MGFNRSKKISASDTWVCPSGVTRANVYLCGGGNGGQGGSGGGGGGTGYATTLYSGGAGAGGGRGDNGAAGQWTVYRNLNVTPGNTYNIVCGAGGTGGAAGAGGAFVATATTAGTAGAAGTAGTQGARSSFGYLANPVQSTPTATNRGGGGGGAGLVSTNGAGGTASSDSASGAAGGAGINTGTSTAGTAVGATSSDGFIPVPDSIGQASNATIKQSVTNPTAGTAGAGVAIVSPAVGAGGGGGCGRNVENTGTVVVHDFDPYVDPGFVNAGAAHPSGGTGGWSTKVPADTILVTDGANSGGFQQFTVPTGHGLVVGDVVQFVPGVATTGALTVPVEVAGCCAMRVTASATTTVTTSAATTIMTATGIFVGTLRKILGAVRITSIANNGGTCRFTTTDNHNLVVGQIVGIVLTTGNSSIWRVTNVPTGTSFDTGATWGATSVGYVFLASSRQVVSIANNGGTCRIYFAQPLVNSNLRVGSTLCVSATSVSGYNVVHTITAITNTYVDTSVSYTADATGGFVAPCDYTTITAVANNGSGKCRVTTSSAHPFQTGDWVFTRVPGTAGNGTGTAGNGTIAVIDSHDATRVRVYATATHGLSGGETVGISGTGSGGFYDGTYTIQYLNATDFLIVHTFFGNMLSGGSWAQIMIGYAQVTYVDSTHYDLLSVNYVGTITGWAYALDGYLGAAVNTLSAGHPFACFDAILSGIYTAASKFGYLSDQTSETVVTPINATGANTYMWPMFKGRLITSVANNGASKARLTTASAHNIAVGDNVYVKGMTVTAYNGAWRAEAVTSNTVDIGATYSTTDSGGAICGGICWGWDTATGTRGWSVLSGLHGYLGNSASAQPANSGFGGLGGGGGAGGGGGPGLVAQTNGVVSGQWGWAGKGGNGGKGGDGGSGFCLITWYTP